MYHTKEESTKKMDKLNNLLNIDLVNTSYLNDECDSLSNIENELTIFLPNTQNNIFWFCVVYNEEYSETIETIEEVIQYIKNLNL